MEGRAKMGDGNERRDHVHHRASGNGVPDRIWKAGPDSVAYHVYTHGSARHDIGMDSHNRKPGNATRLPTWYHWARVITATGFVILSLIVWMVYGG